MEYLLDLQEMQRVYVFLNQKNLLLLARGIIAKSSCCCGSLHLSWVCFIVCDFIVTPTAAMCLGYKDLLHSFQS